ncbi:MAG: tetratricopeptide repeat protein [Planctomycetes bacterium]|nr:tetratricopeptide repeat protein [Planctomycetota bacterium]
MYPEFASNEKSLILNGLLHCRHPQFRELAGQALTTSDHALVHGAATALTQEGSGEGEKLIIDALEHQSAIHLIRALANALGSFGSPEGRLALIRLKNSDDDQKVSAAKDALKQISLRSPGFQYVLQAQQHLVANRPNNVPPGTSVLNEVEVLYGMAIQADEFLIEAYLGRGILALFENKLEQAKLDFEKAIELDPRSPEAYSGRGKLFLKQSDFLSAGKDFERVLEYKQERVDSEVITGLALARAIEGKLEQAASLVEEKRTDYEKLSEGLYSYNAACVYSRICEYLDQHPDVADRDTRRTDARSKAFSNLHQSIQQGFKDFDWMSKDPDFGAIRDDPEFKKILEEKNSGAKDSKPKEEE